MLGELWQDLRYGLRSIRRSPAFTAVVVLTLALGIGANAAIFGLCDALLLRALPVRNPAGLVQLSDGTGRGRWDGTFPDRMDLYPYQLYRQLRAENGAAFEDLAAYDSLGLPAMVRGGGAAETEERASGLVVSGNFFGLLGVPAALGRTIAPEDDERASAVVMLSHDYWQRRFGAAPSVVGATLTINGRAYQVIGVGPPGFSGLEVGEPTDLFVPISLQGALERRGSRLEQRDKRWLLVTGRLRPGVTIAAAEAGANLTLQRYLAGPPVVESDPRQRQRTRIGVESGAMGISNLRQGFREPLLVLMSGVALLLLIVCLNVSHLMLVRATRRQRELAVRTALGASRGRLVRQLLTEAALLAGLAAAVAALLTGWLTDSLLALAQVRGLEVRGAGVPVFTAALALGTALLMGLAPSWQVSHVDPHEGMRRTVGGSRRLLSRLLLVSQVALSLVLVVGAGLLAGSLGRLRGMDKGFDEEHLLTVELQPHETGLQRAETKRLMEEVVERVRALPGVRAASLSLQASPMQRGGWGEAVIADGGRSTGLKLAGVSPDWFGTMGMTLRTGRAFTADDRAGAPRVAIVNQTLARRLFGEEPAVGKIFRFDPRQAPSMPRDPVQVVGEVPDAPNNGLRRRTVPMAYLPLAQIQDDVGTMEVRTSADPAALADQVRRIVRAAHPGLAGGLGTMRSQVERSLWRERLLTVLATGFGLMALFLVSLGLYGVVAQWAAQRIPEIGVRMALGATSGGVRWLVLRQAFQLALVGVAAGIPAAIAGAQLLKGVLYGVQPVDPATLLGAALAMFAVAALAAYLPARRASRVDPMAALRVE